MELKKTKINIGSGGRPLATPTNEWDDVDVRPEMNPTIVADIREIPKPNESYDEVWVHSVLEHFQKREIRDCLKEWARLLKKGGKITISVPDMKMVATDLLKSNSDQTDNNLINLIYGEQDYKENAHKWGFTNKSLINLLREYGFDEFVRLPSTRYPQELLIKAKKYE
jgi:predicted SAM-dependent methyltransferase